MSLVASVATFFIMWWVVLFAVLPWGVRTQQDEGEVEPGTAAGAPIAPMLRRKFAVTTLITALLFSALYATITYELIGLEDIMPIPDFRG